MKRQKESGADVRDLALGALLAIDKEEGYSHTVLAALLEKYDYIEARDKALIKRLTEGTLERRIALDYCIDAFSKLPVLKMKPFIRELLRMSVYQLLFMEGIPDRAVCSEALRLAQKHSFASLKGFVNGILRNISRNKDTLIWPDRESDRSAYLSVRYSMPLWFIEKWDREQGEERTETILRGLLEERTLTVRLRGGMSGQDREALQRELEKAGIEVLKDQTLACAWHLKNTEGLSRIPAFAEGKFTVQDVSSMLAALAAGIRPGDRVLDICAAPGGKTLFAAELAGDGGRVLARDISAKRMERIEENLRRMRISTVTLENADALVYDERLEKSADVVLADLPCSGLGVIGRKPDIKYRVTPQTAESLPALQKEILKTVWRYVRPGGVLLYSTCTISRAENEEVREWFLQNAPFRADSLRAYLPDDFTEDTIERGFLQILPGFHAADGFFIARFIRDGEL